jgi:hypothetical protein
VPRSQLRSGRTANSSGHFCCARDRSECKKWSPTIISYACKVISVTVAVLMQSRISAIQSVSDESDFVAGRGLVLTIRPRLHRGRLQWAGASSRMRG